MEGKGVGGGREGGEEARALKEQNRQAKERVQEREGWRK